MARVDQGKLDLAFQTRVQAVEDAAAGTISGPARDAIAVAARRLVNDWVKAFGSLDAEPTSAAELAAIRSRFVAALRALPLDVEAALLDAANASVRVGIKHAAAVIAAHGDDAPTPRPRVPADTVKAARAAAPAARDRLDRTIGLARGATSYADMARAVADTQGVLGVLHRATVEATFGASAAGVRAVTERAGISRVWVAERDACLNCAGHAGHVAGPGGAFPAGLTFNPKGDPFGATDSPPLHPHCRCTVSPYSPDWFPDRAVTYADALKREARRSVLQGRSAYDPNGMRLTAAGRLLATVDAPKSVKDQARRAIVRGQFQARPDPARARANRAARQARQARRTG